MRKSGKLQIKKKHSLPIWCDLFVYINNVKESWLSKLKWSFDGRPLYWVQQNLSLLKDFSTLEMQHYLKACQTFIPHHLKALYHTKGTGTRILLCVIVCITKHLPNIQAQFNVGIKVYQLNPQSPTSIDYSQWLTANTLKRLFKWVLLCEVFSPAQSQHLSLCGNS